MADETNGDDGFTYYPQVNQTPTTAIEGDVVDIVTAADLDADVEQTGSSFGVVFEEPEVVGGTLWRNSNIPDDFVSVSEYNDTIRMAKAEGDDNTNYVRGREVTDEGIEEAQATLDDLGVDYENESYDELKVGGTDYKLYDLDDRAAEVATVEVPSTGETVETGVDFDGRSYDAEQVDEFDGDRIMVWYGGVAGQRIGRALDFNGMPFARYTEDGYLIKGLLQAAIGWRGDADVEQFGDVPSTDRSKLATDLGRKPRVCRPPVLRDDLDSRVFVAIGRYNGGQMYETQMGRAADDYDEILSTIRADDDPSDLFDAIDMKYDQEPEETLAAEFDNAGNIYSLYTGEGWQSKPANAQSVLGDDGEDTDGSSFDIEADGDDGGVDHPTDEETTFAKMVAEKMTGATNDDGEPATPDEAFASQGGLAAVVESNAENFDNEYDLDAIEAEVYEYVDHLNAAEA